MIAIAVVVYFLLGDKKTPSPTTPDPDQSETETPQVTLIKQAAKKWGGDNSKDLPTNEQVLMIKVSELITFGYLSKDEVTETTGCVTISYDTDTKQHDYEYEEVCN